MAAIKWAVTQRNVVWVFVVEVHCFADASSAFDSGLVAVCANGADEVAGLDGAKFALRRFELDHACDGVVAVFMVTNNNKQTLCSTG